MYTLFAIDFRRLDDQFFVVSTEINKLILMGRQKINKLLFQ